MILGFAHPALVVPDLDRARDFYRNMFGFEVTGEEGWSDSPEVDRAVGLEGSSCRGLMMKGHNCFLELFEFETPDQVASPPGDLGAHEPGIRHLSFYVDDVRVEYARLQSLGGSALGEPMEVHDGARAVYARDPFGNIIELCEVAREEESLLKLPGVSSLGNHRV